jgi:hypothetical protein
LDFVGWLQCQTPNDCHCFDRFPVALPESAAP